MRIYLLEDDDSIRKLVIYALASQGYEAQGFGCPSQFYQALEECRPDLVLLDIMLPEEDGLTVLQKLRSSPQTRKLPVVMLTAKNAEYDRVQGLDAGADDFISKPFGMMELLARVRALLRRTEPAGGDQVLRCGCLTVSRDRHTVEADGTEVVLTNKEFQLLWLLMEQQGKVVPRQELMDRVWGLGSERENRTLDVHIRTLRAKLGPAGQYVETVRGVGYRMGGPA